MTEDKNSCGICFYVFVSTVLFGLGYAAYLLFTPMVCAYFEHYKTTVPVTCSIAIVAYIVWYIDPIK